MNSEGPSELAGRSLASRRLDVIDAARGTAMLFVFVSHFVEAFYRPFPQLHPHTFQLLTRIATPSFVWISGVTLAVLHARNRERFGSMRDRLIDRGLFLVLVGHLLLVPAYRFMEDSWADAFRVVFITDTLGLCVIVGALVITKIGARGRLLLGTAVLLSAWILTTAWTPRIPSVAWMVKDFLVGDLRDHWLDYNFPPIPWLGFYLIASAIGDVFVRYYDSGRERSLVSGMIVMGVASIATAMLVKVAGQALMAGGPSGSLALAHITAITHKLPPSPAYLLLYAGLALLMFAGLLLARRTRAGLAFASWVALFGRYSLAAFLCQFYVYYLAVSVLPRPPAMFIGIYFFATVIAVRVLVLAWARLDGNRLITVGYPALRRSRPAQVPSAFEVVPVQGPPPAPPAVAQSADDQPTRC